MTHSSGNSFDRQETDYCLRTLGGKVRIIFIYISAQLASSHSYERTRLSLKYLFVILLCDREAYFSLIDSSVSLWVVPGNRSNRIVELFHLLWQVCFSRGRWYFPRNGKKQRSVPFICSGRVMSALNWSAACGLKRKVKRDWLQPCAFYGPPALFFHRLSRSAGIFRDTKTSRCHVTGGLPPLNNACLFWEILPRAKAAFGIGSIIPAAALEFDEGAAKYCGTSFCLFVLFVAGLFSY